MAGDMGKRSNFKRRERDFYPTPPSAVKPLVPHIEDRATFIEPCAGNGALIDHLSAAGLRCCAAFDIFPKRHDVRMKDALSAESSLRDAEYIITNPPWSRDILHRMIVHFSDQRPTWLLFDADWMHTKQAAPYLPRLRKVVSVGRVKWIPDSPHTGKDNCAWHLFDKPSDRPAEFFGRAA